MIWFFVLAVFIAVALALYMLPWFIGRSRAITNTTPLFWLNLLLGWTSIVWIACLVWAVVEQPDPRRRQAGWPSGDPTGGRRVPPPLPLPALPAPGDDAAIWFYEAAGQRVGPVSQAALLQLYGARRIQADTLCWQPAFGASWRSFANAHRDG